MTPIDLIPSLFTIWSLKYVFPRKHPSVTNVKDSAREAEGQKLENEGQKLGANKYLLASNKSYL